jgi:hypothetical protein
MKKETKDRLDKIVRKYFKDVHPYIPDDVMRFLEQHEMDVYEILGQELSKPSKLTAWDKDLKMWYKPS